jgi:hypothetical protein
VVVVVRFGTSRSLGWTSSTGGTSQEILSPNIEKLASSVAGFDRGVGVFLERLDRRSLSTACGSRSPANNRQVIESSSWFTVSESMTEDRSERLSSGTALAR